MDDDGVSSEQARVLRRVLDAAGIGVGALWLHYFRLGGEVGEVEVDAYLHHALRLPRFERDLVAHAANELIDRGSGRWALYACEVLAGDRGDGAGDHRETASDVDADGGAGEGPDGASGADGRARR
ncbi:hypothetical protein ACH9EU_00175 [Kocuria sp. M1R5S2]|uniref:hypothetical protein n=1 Tax=Kocuria rhizosphaerae TaxID=3376285 RepID=UPI0037AD2FA6